VRGAAADDDTERDDRVVTVLRQRRRDDRQLERARDPYDGRVLDLEIGEGTLGTGDEPVHHLLVPAGGDDRDPKVVAVDRRGLVVRGGRSFSAHDSS
jgi:hypothetical protein